MERLFMKLSLALYAVIFSLFTTKADSAGLPSQNKAVLENVTIVISSCGKYSDLWTPVSTLLFKHWPSLKTYNKHIPVVLIATDKDFSFEGVTVFKIENDKGWSANMLAALKTIKTKYIIYLQEDYLISQPVNEARLKELLDAMKEGLAAHIELTFDTFFNESDPHPTIPGVSIKGKHQGYRTSLQPGLWKKDTLEWLVNPEEDPWKFEINGSVRSEGMREPFLVVGKDFPMQFVNGCNLGFWSEGTLEFLEKEGIVIQDTSLPEGRNYPFTRKIQKFAQLYPRFSWVYKKWTTFLSVFDEKFKKAAPKPSELKQRMAA